MAEVTVTIAGRQYALHCRDGEEAHIDHLASLVDAKARQVSGMTEVRQLLFAALFMADEVNDLKREAAGRQGALALGEEDDASARAVEKLAERIEALAERLAPVASAS